MSTSVSPTAPHHLNDRYFQAMDVQFNLRRNRPETVAYMRTTFNLSEFRAVALYEEFASGKRSRYRRYITLALLSGLVSLVGVNVMASVSDQINISPAGTLLTLVPALFFSPFLVWAVLRTWKSTGQTALSAAGTVVLYTGVIWAMILQMALLFAVFVIVTDID